MINEKGRRMKKRDERKKREKGKEEEKETEKINATLKNYLVVGGFLRLW